jgi:hypothetical protein
MPAAGTTWPGPSTPAVWTFKLDARRGAAAPATKRDKRSLLLEPLAGMVGFVERLLITLTAHG